MKFECRHRNSDGSIAISFIDVSSRKEAFKYARSYGWNVVEMRQTKNNEKIRRNIPTHNVKTVSSEPKEMSEDTRVCRNSYVIGCFSSLFPIIGWIIALFATFVKYDFRGLIHCVIGSITSSISVLMIVFGVGLFFGQIFELAEVVVNLSKIPASSFIIIPILSGVIICIGIDFVRLPYRKIINRT